MNNFNDLPVKTRLEIISYIRDKCYDAAKEAYNEAAISGLCADGAIEYSLDAIRSLNIDPILKHFSEK